MSTIGILRRRFVYFFFFKSGINSFFFPWHCRNRCRFYRLRLNNRCSRRYRRSIGRLCVINQHPHRTGIIVYFFLIAVRITCVCKRSIVLRRICVTFIHACIRIKNQIPFKIFHRRSGIKQHGSACLSVYDGRAKLSLIGCCKRGKSARFLRTFSIDVFLDGKSRALRYFGNRAFCL